MSWKNGQNHSFKSSRLINFVHSATVHMEMARMMASPHFRSTYPINTVDLMLMVPTERRVVPQSYAHSNYFRLLVDCLIFLNAFVRKTIAKMLDAPRARSMARYYIDTFGLIHGVSSTLPLINVAEYVFRLSLTIYSSIYSTQICMMYMQYASVISQPAFVTVNDVAHSDLPVYCLSNTMLGFENEFQLPYTNDCRASTADIRAQPIDGMQALDLVDINKKRLGFLISMDRWRGLREMLWHQVTTDDMPYRVIRKPVGQQYQTLSTSLFDRNVTVYERYLRRFEEHGFLQFFSTRQDRILYARFLMEQREFERVRDQRFQIYAPIRMTDLQMVFGTMYFTWTTSTFIFVVECTWARFCRRYNWRVTDRWRFLRLHNWWFT